jgi:acyl-CoA hydrolase
MPAPHRPQLPVSINACVDAILERVGKRVVLGLPVGIGKPNLLVNELVARALADPTLKLTIFTALSLRTPRWHSDLERRFLQPFVRRVFGDYPELEYVRLLERGQLPANIQVNEFFLEPGGWLRNESLQQQYLSSNYTHVARDLIARGVNVIAQLVAMADDEPTTVSLGSNPDLWVDLLPHVHACRATGTPLLLVGQVHRQLPFTYGDAQQPRAEFDLLLDQPELDRPLFCPPNLPIGTVDYAIALHVAALVRDGGTLQLGIGELGDAIVYALQLRHQRPADFKALIAATNLAQTHAALLASGGMDCFEQGLYGCTEMLADGFMDLYRSGILRRRVYGHALLQTLLDEGRIGEQVGPETLDTLAAAGLELTRADFAQLQLAGVFRDDVRFHAQALHCHGRVFGIDLSDAEQRAELARHCLDSNLRNGVVAHGGFFFGPQGFYAALRDLPRAERKQFAMQRISFVNELYGVDQALKIAQRRHARFVNTTMMVTGLGAAVSDGLANGTVVSGVGGQYNFVAMAHTLPEARSLLCLRSTRTAQGRTTSNIVWNYGHTTIPRHLRDLVITEYGVADLRSRTDSEVVAALVAVMDARFQDSFVAQAKRADKLPVDYRIPERARGNLPGRLANWLQPWRQQGLFGDLPFGSDFTADELVIAKALRRLQASTATRSGKVKTALRAILAGVPPATERYLPRLELDNPTTLTRRLEQRAVAQAIYAIIKTSESA